MLKQSFFSEGNVKRRPDSKEVKMIFKNFDRKTSNIKIQKIFSLLSLSDVKIYLGGAPFSSGIGIVNLH